MTDLFEHNLDLRDSFWNIGRDEMLLRWIHKGPVLDVGCGVGIMTERLMQNGFETYSIDCEERACEITKKINNNTFCVDITHIDEREYPKFKTIIVLDVLEHIKDDRKALERINKLLDDDGILIVSVPYHNLLWNKTDRYHHRRYSRTQLQNTLGDTGFEVIQMKLWNMLSLIPLIVSKLLRFEVSHKSLAHSKFNRLLTWYFIHFENKIPVPIGSQLFCLAEKN